MFARFGKMLVIALLVLTTGLHWAALQMVAWSTMLAANLTTTSFNQAVSDTFDGQHPCCLCKAVAAGKKAQKESEAGAPVLKMEFPPVTETMVLYAPACFQLLPQENLFAGSKTAKPPSPPPRSFFA